jgi:hypothetical protein
MTEIAPLYKVRHHHSHPNSLSQLLVIVGVVTQLLVIVGVVTYWPYL